MNRHHVSGLLFAALLAAGCTTTADEPVRALDSGQWRTAKSRMYQDLAMQCLQADDRDRALQLLQQAVQFDPADASSLELLARLATADGNLPAATAAAQLLLRVQPESPTAWCTLGAAAEAANDPTVAEQAYRRAARSAGDDPRPAIDLHRLLLAEQREPEAQALRTELARRHPRRVEPLLDHAAWLASAGRWSEATAAFDAALQQKPGEPAAAAGLALGALLSRQPGTALALCDRLPPRARADHPTLQMSLAIAHLQNGDLDAALRELDAADAWRTEPVPVRLLRAELLFRLRRHDAALAEYEQVLAATPDDPRANLGCGRVLLLLQRPHAAVRSLQLAVARQPGNAGGRALLCTALAASGDVDAARREFDALRTLPDSAELASELRQLHPELRSDAAEGRR
ncbi:MAG: tetratricopeptide repeat protein [Planctomycetes bacterium]|nr:tetratricopeptide repeat protein [Planctomycetota bacterium]